MYCPSHRQTTPRVSLFWGAIALGCGSSGGGATGTATGGGGGTPGDYADCRTLDVDGDGFDDASCGGDDCNDEDHGIFPGALVGFSIESITGFPRPTDPTGQPEDFEISAALDGDGKVVIAFEGDGGFWFGRQDAGSWQLRLVSPMSLPAFSGASVAVAGDGRVVLGFAQTDTSPVPMLARETGNEFTLETIADVGGPPVLATGPDGTLYLGVATTQGTNSTFGMAPEVAGTFSLVEVPDIASPDGTRMQIDQNGGVHLVYGAYGSSRTPPYRYVYHTDQSGSWEITEFPDQVFFPKASLLIDGTDMHFGYVRPRNLQAVHYQGPADSDPRPVVGDAKDGFADPPVDQGTALALFQGSIRIAYATSDGIYVASQGPMRFASSPVEVDSEEFRAFAAPEFLVSSVGLHLFYFAGSTNSTLVLRHAFLGNDAPLGCQE